MARILAADPPHLPSRPARERRLVIDGALARVYTMTMLAMTHYQAGDPTGGDWALELAQSACREPRPYDAAPTVARIAHCLDAARSAVGSSGSGPLPLLWVASVLAVSEGADRLGEAVPQGTHSEG